MNLPLGWLQLRHRPVRLLVALSGIAFAVLLVMMQVGFRAALFESKADRAVHDEYADGKAQQAEGGEIEVKAVGQLADISNIYRSLQANGAEYEEVASKIVEEERPPMIDLQSPL